MNVITRKACVDFSIAKTCPSKNQRFSWKFQLFFNHSALSFDCDLDCFQTVVNAKILVNSVFFNLPTKLLRPKTTSFRIKGEKGYLPGIVNLPFIQFPSMTSPFSLMRMPFPWGTFLPVSVSPIYTLSKPFFSSTKTLRL